MEKARTIYILSRLHYALRQKIETALADTKLTAVQYTVLNMLQGRERLSSAEIARRYCVKPQSMNETIFALEKRGLIFRQENPDNKRILLVTLTDTGRAMLGQCDALVDVIESEIFTGLTNDERETFRLMARKVLTVALHADETL